MPQIRIELLGTLRITCGDTPVASVNTARMQSLLAYVVLHAEAPQSREHLAYLLWPESEESQARTNLRQVLHHLRRALPADCFALITDNQTVQWRRGPDCTVDVFEFEAAVTRGAHAAQRGDCASEREELEEAAHLYQDDLIRNLYDEWLQPKREDLRRRLIGVLHRLVLLLEELGDYASAIQYADRLLAQDPLAEANYQVLMRLHSLNHDRASAVRVYHQCMGVLKRELGLIPGAATRELFGHILKSGPPPPDRSERPSSLAASAPPMIGRKKEWERLIDSWRIATEAGLHLTLITGEPGIGKSRLAEELRQWCYRNDSAVARARCYAAQGRLAYGPIADWLGEQPLGAALALLPRTQLSELARVLPELLVENPDLSPAPMLTESWQRRHLYEALKAAFSKVGKPLLLLIDDLQWCDQDSFEWLHWMFRSASSEHIMILGTVRPEETGREHPLAGLLRELRGAGQVDEIALSALSAEETAELAAQVAKRPLDAEQNAQLYERTRGNPLFVVETVQAQMGNQPSDLALPHAPQKVHAVITARLAQLSAPAYELAGWASVVGRSFSFDLLAKATDWDEESVARALEELWQRRIIEGQGVEAYDFTHDRLREVAYSELSPVRRRFLHRRIARALQEIHGAEREIASAQLAPHYEAAGMVQEAIQSYQTAAGIAQQRCADVEATALMRRALALCSSLPESPRRDAHELESLVRLGASLFTIQGYGTPEVVKTYERALQLARRLGDSRHLSSALAGVWIFGVVRGSIEASRDVALECLDLAQKRAEENLLITGHFLLGSSLFHLGQFESSRRHLEQALTGDGAPSERALLHLFGGPDVGVFCRCYFSHVLWHMGFPDLAARTSDQAIALATEKSHPFSLAIALNYAAMLQVFSQQSRLALARAEEAAAVCRKYDFRYYLAMAEAVAGWARGMEETPAEGLAQLKNAVEALRATGAELRLPLYNGMLAQICGRMGQTGEALANIATGFAFQNKNAETWVAAELHRIQGDLLRDAGNVKEARNSYLRALEAARKIKALMAELQAAIRICLLPLSQEKLKDAREALRDVYSRFTEGFETPDLKEVRCLLEPASRSA